MQYIIMRAISWFSQLIVFALMLRAILSWFGQDPYSSAGKIYRIMVRVTEPVVAPCRQLLSRFNTGMMDFSVFLAFFLVEIAAKVLMILVSIIF